MCGIRAYCFLFAHSGTFTRSKCSYDGLIVALLLANTYPFVSILDSRNDNSRL